MTSSDIQLTEQPHVVIAGNWELRVELGRCLRSFYRFEEYSDISQTLASCRARAPLLVLVSEKLPLTGGYDFVRLLRLEPQLAAIPVIIVADVDDKRSRDAAMKCGANNLITPPFDRGDLVTKVSGLVNRGVEHKWKRLPTLQRQALTETLRVFNGISSFISDGRPIQYKTVCDACEPLVEVVNKGNYRTMLRGIRDHDNYSYTHSMRVATYLALFGHSLGLPRSEQTLLATGGLLHDLGKMAIPHEVLNKPGKLDEDELAIMRGHVPATVEYLKGWPDLPKGVMTIAAQHHEKLDGTGYPAGLAGSELNRLARMAAIIDVFTALTDRRCYKPPIEPETALKIMTDEMTSHLDVKLLTLFRQMLLDATRSLRPMVAELA
jgi:putative nucleotidyltransferase with HDIG domain